jgi:hypothetical protein
MLADGPQARRELILVEGVIDFHQLRAHGVENVAALGSLAVQPNTFERLARLRVERMTLCLDRDEPGRAATVRAVEQSCRAERSPAVYVIDPERLAPAKDPDALVRERGVEAWRGLLGSSECGIAWRAKELLAGVTPRSDRRDRRAALARAGAWLGGLPARLALEQEDAIRAVSLRCGYSPEAVERAFRARFWADAVEPCREPHLTPRPRPALER